MKLVTIRKKFLQFFEEQGHAIFPSSSVVPHQDPSLLFVNAGMNQFKNIFLGKEPPIASSVTTVQKCIRVGGKHNDLENVGHTSRHLTFFEMFGNFSFGSYFKKEAIHFAWRVSTEVFGIDPSLLWISVFTEDDEALDYWSAYLPSQRIIRMEENFWAMGDTGPCGPCSELLLDRGARYGTAASPKEDVSGERFLEFWNLVFMSFDRGIDGVLRPLPRKCIDTGGGLERIGALLQNVDSVFKIDLFVALIMSIQRYTSIPYREDHESASAFHVIADHLRSSAFAISDGVLPSNVDRGYVLRKIIRRAVRYARTLHIERPFLAELVPTLIELMGASYPELIQSKETIQSVLTQEEEAFLMTLKKGGSLLHRVLEEAHQTNHLITGEQAFMLKDTYGLPLEEISLLAQDAGCRIDIVSFTQLEEQAKERSRKVQKKGPEDLSFFQTLSQHYITSFVGYDHLCCSGHIIGLIHEHQLVETLQQGQEGYLILDTSSFYAEKGGQVGDHGEITAEGGSFSVTDCVSPIEGLILHKGTVQQGTLRLHDPVSVQVDGVRRRQIAANHSATHLLRWALTELFGSHIKQAGSVVEPSRLRFDFMHPRPLTALDLFNLETLINEQIRNNTTLQIYELPLQEAQKNTSIVQTFGEHYGSTVRVVDMRFVQELCCGTHVGSLGEIGWCKIIKEQSIASGIRRIEAVTGKEAESLVYQWQETLEKIRVVLKIHEGEEIKKIKQLQQELKETQTERDHYLLHYLQGVAKELTQKIVHNKIPFLIAELDIPPADFKTILGLLAQHVPTLAVLLIHTDATLCYVTARVSRDLLDRVDAKEWIHTFLLPLNGKGGGKNEYAQGSAPKGFSKKTFEEAKQQAYRYIDA